MPKPATPLDFAEIKLFLPAYTSELVRLVKHISNRNAQTYKRSDFNLLYDSALDPFLIVGETPDLGEDQLGVFAGKKYLKGERVALYKGEVLCEKSKTKKVAKFIKNYSGVDDYIWQLDCGDGDSVAIDACFKGSIARLINDSENPNTEMEYIDGECYYIATRDINFGEEITTSYGEAYFNEINHTRKLTNYIARNPSHLNSIIQSISKDNPTTEITNINDLKILLENRNCKFSSPDIETINNIDLIKVPTQEKSNKSFLSRKRSRSSHTEKVSKYQKTEEEKQVSRSSGEGISSEIEPESGHHQDKSELVGFNPPTSNHHAFFHNSISSTATELDKRYENPKSGSAPQVKDLKPTANLSYHHYEKNKDLWKIKSRKKHQKNWEANVVESLKLCQKNPEEITVRTRKTPEETAADAKARYEANLEESRKEGRERYWKNREAISERRKVKRAEEKNNKAAAKRLKAS